MKGITMDDLNVVEILLVEDNPRAAELTIRALKKNNLANKLYHVEDGVEAGVGPHPAQRPAA
jgi:hypothetical protein